MAETAPRRFVAFVGFAIGSFAGGAAFWLMGYYAWVEPLGHSIETLFAFLTLLVLPMSLVAPFALVRYLGRNLEEGLARYLVALAGYVLLVGFAVIMAYFGGFEALGIETGEEALAFFGALFGAVFGGILGATVTTRIAEPGVRSDDDRPGWEEDQGWGEESDSDRK